jgi:hypothetical protein
MRRCLQCGVENLELARFCSNCGNPLLVVRPQTERPAAAPFSPGLPGPIVQEPPRQNVPESAWPPVQEPYYPPSRPQVARPHEQSPFVSEKPFSAPPPAASLPASPFSAPQSAAPLPASPFVSLSRNQPEIYPRYSNPAYAPTIPHSIPPLAATPVKKKRHTLIFALLGIVVVLILVVVGLFLFLSSDKQPKLSVIQGQPIPGQQITLQGEHFPNGSKISVVVDTGLLVSSPQSINSFLIQSTLVPVSSTETNGVVYRAVVGSDGTFTIKIRIPLTWKSGSQHTILAEVAGTNAQPIKPVQYQITIA